MYIRSIWWLKGKDDSCEKSNKTKIPSKEKGKKTTVELWSQLQLDWQWLGCPREAHVWKKLRKRLCISSGWEGVTGMMRMLTGNRNWDTFVHPCFGLSGKTEEQRLQFVETTAGKCGSSEHAGREGAGLMPLGQPGLLCSTEGTRNYRFLWGEGQLESWEPQMGSFWHQLGDPGSKGWWMGPSGFTRMTLAGELY